MNNRQRSKKKRYLLKVQKLQDIYTSYHRAGLSNVQIYERYVKVQFGIALSTMYDYLSVPVKVELSKLTENGNIIQNRSAGS